MKQTYALGITHNLFLNKYLNIYSNEYVYMKHNRKIYAFDLELEIIWEIVSGNIYSGRKQYKKLFYLIRK